MIILKKSECFFRMSESGLPYKLIPERFTGYVFSQFFQKLVAIPDHRIEAVARRRSVLENNLQTSQEKHQCQKRLQHRCFPVNFDENLRAPFSSPMALSDWSSRYGYYSSYPTLGCD